MKIINSLEHGQSAASLSLPLYQFNTWKKFNVKDAIFLIGQAWSEIRVKAMAGARKQILKNEAEIKKTNEIEKYIL